MTHPHDPFATIRSASRYVRQFRSKIFVVKFGGELLDDAKLRKNLAAQLAVLWSFSIPVVIVHGGGTGLDSLCETMGLPTEKVAGRRVTPPEVLEAAKMAFKGRLQMDLLADLEAAGVPTVGLSGLDGGLVRAEKRPPVLVDGQLVDFGLVGDVKAVDPALLRHLLAGGYVPVVAPFTADAEGQVFNTNADTVAASLAQALGAEKLFFLLTVPGLLRNVEDPSSLVPFADLKALEALERAGSIKTGMRPKITAAKAALQGGVPAVHIVSGATQDGLLMEVFTNEGSGTMLVAQGEAPAAGNAP
ncbi:MAG: acetylglutamate kinase [Acidobacteria bacterium]|nr:acetylglutamate kinase [Acidobacteriota bacterium]